MSANPGDGIMAKAQPPEGGFRAVVARTRPQRNHVGASNLSRCLPDMQCGFSEHSTGAERGAIEIARIFVAAVSLR